METCRRKIYTGNRKRFKSYYVVWKPRSKMKNNIVSGEFKSYYVVWKPIFLLSFRPDQTWFKSYYVVWKLYFLHAMASLLAGLNRTMQYGNDFYSQILKVLCLFKSYYVVWKLFSFLSDEEKTKLFKSYYVVWKQYIPKKNHFPFSGLNRTMQYGNIRLSSLFSR